MLTPDFDAIDNHLAGLGLDPEELQRRLFGQHGNMMRPTPLALPVPQAGEGRPMDAAGLPRRMDEGGRAIQPLPVPQQAATGTLGTPRTAAPTPAPAANPLEGLPLPQPRGADLTPAPARATARPDNALPVPAGASPAAPLVQPSVADRYRTLSGQEPRQDQFPASKLKTWQKILLPIASFAAEYGRPGSGVAAMNEGFGGPQREAEKKFTQAHQQWEGQLGRIGEEAKLAHLGAETAKLGRPVQDKPDTLTAQEAQAVEELVAKGVSRVDAIGRVKGAGKTDKPEPGIEDDRRYEAIRLAQKLGKPVSKEDAAWADVHKERKRDPSIAEGTAATRATGREDKSYQFHAARVDKLRQPIEQRMERISRLEDTLNQNTPQADALIAPELLTVMAGGQGSGLRMNEAEIARIIGGRTNWETLKAKINAWQLDPNKPFSLTPAQRQQTRQLFGAIRDRVTQKAQVIDEESEKLANSSDPQEHRNIYNRLQKRLGQIDSGGAATGAAGAEARATGQDVGPAPAGKADGATGTLPDGTKVIVRSGRLIAQ